MSANTTSNYGKPWTVIGRFPDFETANLARAGAPAGFQAKIHRQHEIFVVKIRELPKDEEATETEEALAPKKTKKAKVA